jgi:hypothetical protein
MSLVMCHQRATRIFFGMRSGNIQERVGLFGHRTVMDFSGVTADHVADAIDNYLKEAA